MDAQVMPRFLRNVDPIVPGGLLDVGESLRSIFIGHVDDLIEPRYGVAHVASISHRLFALFWECVDTIRKIALRGELTVFFVRFPSGLHGNCIPARLVVKHEAKSGGEGGIRTHERVLAVTRFRGERYRPTLPPLQNSDGAFSCPPHPRPPSFRVPRHAGDFGKRNVIIVMPLLGGRR